MQSALYTEKTSDGKARYKMPYVDLLTGKTRRVSVTFDKDTPRNRRAAAEILEKKIAEKLGKKLPTSETIENAATGYYMAISRRLRPQTVETYKATLAPVFRQFDASAIVSRITPQMWENAIFDAAGNNAAYNNKLKYVKMFLNHCYKNNIIPNDDVLRKLDTLPVTVSHRETIQDKYLEPDEIKKLLAYLQRDACYCLLTEFLILSGCRVGEALALDLSDVGAQYITINKTLSAITGDISEPKTIASRRQIYIQPELADCIRRIKQWRASQMLAYRFNAANMLFTKKGKYLIYNTYLKALKAASVASIGREITPHTLRHTSASLMVAAGVPVDTISRRLGHETDQITRQIYLHVTKKMKKADEAQFDKITLLG